jgi:chorismate mutase
MQKTLDELRKEIDATDAVLLTTIAKRMTLVREVGKVKKISGIAPLDENRWNKLLTGKLLQAKSLQLSEEFIEKLYTLIHEYSISLQQKLVAIEK